METQRNNFLILLVTVISLNSFNSSEIHTELLELIFFMGIVMLLGSIVSKLRIITFLSDLLVNVTVVSLFILSLIKIPRLSISPNSISISNSAIYIGKHSVSVQTYIIGIFSVIMLVSFYRIYQLTTNIEEISELIGYIESFSRDVDKELGPILTSLLILDRTENPDRIDRIGFKYMYTTKKDIPSYYRQTVKKYNLGIELTKFGISIIVFLFIWSIYTALFFLEGIAVSLIGGLTMFIFTYFGVDILLSTKERLRITTRSFFITNIVIILQINLLLTNITYFEKIPSYIHTSIFIYILSIVIASTVMMFILFKDIEPKGENTSFYEILYKNPLNILGIYIYEMYFSFVFHFYWLFKNRSLHKQDFFPEDWEEIFEQ